MGTDRLFLAVVALLVTVSIGILASVGGLEAAAMGTFVFMLGVGVSFYAWPAQ